MMTFGKLHERLWERSGAVDVKGNRLALGDVYGRDTDWHMLMD